jgi:RNA polymerase sigma-70 factor (ECF subfamily)
VNACPTSTEDTLLGNDAESTLIRKALNGDDKAFRAILERHYPLIYSVVRGIVCNESDAEDVVQDVFVKIFRALPSFRQDALLSTWIYRIARNEALNAREKLRREPVSIEDCGDIAADEGNPESAHGRRTEAANLARLVERLDERQRQAIELRYMAEKSYEEIAEIMNVPLGTVKTHLHRAKLALKQMMTARRAPQKGFGEP